MTVTDNGRVARRTLIVLGLILATALVVLLAYETRRVLTWIVVAAFIAVALGPAVDWVTRRAAFRRRWLATLLVFLVTFALLGGLVTLFVAPLAREGGQAIANLPHIVEDAKNGRGPAGHLIARFHLLQYAQSNAGRIKEYAAGLGAPTLMFLRSVATGIAGTVTIIVLSYLMVLEAPKVTDGFLALFSPEHGERIRRVGHDCAKTITGYITGNLLISVVCGGLTYLTLLLLHVPYAGLIALFVGVADLIPLVGATLGAVVATIAGFVQSTTAGLVIIVFFVVYQQLENHLLQPIVFARTVKLNPLTVLIAILIAVELAGILGALLAIPIAGILQIIVRDVWDTHRGRPKDEPTVGEDRTPADADDTGRPLPAPGTDDADRPAPAPDTDDADRPAPAPDTDRPAPAPGTDGAAHAR
ncbi:AI-2E family transporter [Actinoplanes sp. KI2]|uniref:AI-2E family transporter n=1 Tax=Actinoplanes sp. KI2 TaxID=2983315 RepID=UPI0021D5B6BD|nr:AI-2E family transporter [Actinoplanes sp. KI2]MCU7727986.1 AI-2E family transporter [Actinoplanes sp. KI2]